ncbi:MAG: VOC family protein [Janthinobacterium lividum]
MNLDRVVLRVRDVDVVAGFYRTALGLPVHVGAGTATVVVGRSRLVLSGAEDVSGSHHLAMTIPRGTFPAARSWLEDRAQLLSRDGMVEFEGPAGWNSRSLYFDGPEGAVLELIERRDLPPGRSSTFSTKELLCVSEVGIAVPDVVDAVDLLQRHAGIEAYGEVGHDFAAVGDVDGLLILVRPGRAWLPTADRCAAVSPTVVDASGPRPGSHGLGVSTVVTSAPHESSTSGCRERRQIRS